MTDIDLDAIEARANAYWPDTYDDTEAHGAAADDVRALVAEVRRLRALLDRIAYPALMYDARVYMLSEDAPELLDRLTPELRALVGERPSEVARRVEEERDDARDEVRRLREELVEAENWHADETADHVRRVTSSLTRERDDARAAIARVRALHYPSRGGHECSCGEPIPCATIRALDGDAVQGGNPTCTLQATTVAILGMRHTPRRERTPWTSSPHPNATSTAWSAPEAPTPTPTPEPASSTAGTTKAASPAPSPTAPPSPPSTASTSPPTPPTRQPETPRR